MKNNFLGQEYFSDYDRNCSGYLDSPNGYYVVLPYLGISLIKKQGLPKKLEEIMAFDKAETSFANIGKINAITVSSFISAKGRLAGYDFFSGKDELISNVNGVRIYNLEPLLNVTSKILGTTSQPNYPIFPGSMVPCALKEFYSDREGSEIYCGLAITIPKNRSKNPILIMEDVGFKTDEDILEYAKNATDASLNVCRQQRIGVEKIYVAQKSIKVNKNELGCALVMCSYVHLPRDLKKELED